MNKTDLGAMDSPAGFYPADVGSIDHVRRHGQTFTLLELNYDGNPPRCGSCTKRFIKRTTRPDGKKVRKLMCALAQVPVHARGVCDSWRGFNGEELDA